MTLYNALTLPTGRLTGSFLAGGMKGGLHHLHPRWILCVTASVSYYLHESMQPFQLHHGPVKGSLPLESTDTHVMGRRWVRTDMGLEGCPSGTCAAASSTVLSEGYGGER